MRGTQLKIALTLVLAAGAIATGCGGDQPGSGAGGLAALTPPDAPLFAETVVHADGDQSAAINSFADRIAGLSDPGAALISAVDALFAQNGLPIDYQTDIAPWIGDHAAVFVSSFGDPGHGAPTPELAVLIEASDEGAARDFLDTLAAADTSQESRTYAGVSYYHFQSGPTGIAAGVFDGALVIGTETAFKVAVDASGGESLADSADYTERTAALPETPIASVFLEPAATIEAVLTAQGSDPAPAGAIEPLLGGPLSKPVAAALTATTDTASLEIATTVDSRTSLSTSPSLLDGLPGDAWLAVAVPGLGPALEGSVDNLVHSGIPGGGRLERRISDLTGIEIKPGVLDWLGDAAGFVEGTSSRDFGVGAIGQISDPTAPRSLLETAEKMIEQDTGARSSGAPQGADYGFSIGMPGSGKGFEAGVVGDKLVAVIGTDVAAALHPADPLSSNPQFEAAIGALGPDLSPALYVDLPSFFKVAEQGGDGGVDYAAARPYFSAFASLVAGTRMADGLAVARVTVSLAG